MDAFNFFQSSLCVHLEQEFVVFVIRFGIMRRTVEVYIRSASSIVRVYFVEKINHRRRAHTRAKHFSSLGGDCRAAMQ